MCLCVRAEEKTHSVKEIAIARVRRRAPTSRRRRPPRLTTSALCADRLRPRQAAAIHAELRLPCS